MSSRIVPIASLLVVMAGAAVFRARSESERLFVAASQPSFAVRPRVVPLVAGATSGDFRYVWFDDDGAGHEVARAVDVPADRRDFVRAVALDPRRATPGEVTLVDLAHPRVDGTFPLRSLALDRFSAELAALSGHRWTRRRGDPHPRDRARRVDPMPARVARRNAPAPASVVAVERGFDPPRPVALAPRATVYGAPWCAACRATAAWFRRQGVPFAERDVESDPGARDAMAAVCAREGLACDGIPVVEANGRAMVGYDPRALAEMVGR